MKCKENLCKNVEVTFHNLSDYERNVLERYIGNAVRQAKEEICFYGNYYVEIDSEVE